MSIQSNKNILIEYGLKEGLLNKLGDAGCAALTTFYINHKTESGLLNQMIQLASMEIQGKIGAIQLAKLGIATPKQIKSLTCEQVQEVLEDYQYLQDLALAKKTITTFIIASQQENQALHIATNYTDIRNKKQMLKEICPS